MTVMMEVSDTDAFDKLLSSPEKVELFKRPE